ncbi:MAG TPA: GNAT family N-acetyltransferase [Mobilitalea sp.]|nr:GNAT family N-acetyltransferase [Mobilitalea sp.]
MITYRTAKKSEIDEIAKLQTEAFCNYDYFKMFVDDEKRRIRFLEALQKVGVRSSYKHEVVFVGVENNRIVSAAILKAPKASESNLMDYILAGGIRVLLTGGVRNTIGFIKMMKESSSRCFSEYPDSWYLTSLSVSSFYQGQGLGSKMLDECIKPYIAKNGGGLLTLITNSELNRSFYKKNGFIEFHESVIRRNGKQIGNWSYRQEIMPL